MLMKSQTSKSWLHDARKTKIGYFTFTTYCVLCILIPLINFVNKEQDDQYEYDT